MAMSPVLWLKKKTSRSQVEGWGGTGPLLCVFAFWLPDAIVLYYSLCESDMKFLTMLCARHSNTITKCESQN